MTGLDTSCHLHGHDAGELWTAQLLVPSRAPATAASQETQRVRAGRTSRARREEDDVTPSPDRAVKTGSAVRPGRTGAELPSPRGPSRGERSGQLLRQSLHRLDEAAHLLAGPAGRADVSAALAAVLEVRRALAHLVRPDDSRPAVDRPSVLRRTELVARPEAAREARAFARETCERWQLSGAVGSVVTDLAGELVDNAARHGRSPVQVALELGAGQVSVSVYDDGPGRPELLPYRPGVSERGLGLQLVQRLSDRWGWTADGDGKWVWARVSLPAVTSPEEVLPDPVPD